ncbi:MAG: histidine phosphatase family protein [Bdellovibrionaceae bacterium]|nr:histidine phosphatase family protein [Pseudobdellovibrionaceae bacterium]
MKLILLRHGDRSPGFSDVPLSEKGLQQAQELTQKQELLGVTQILCSPKRRALQTVEPLTKTLGLHLNILQELDQMRQIESPNDFMERVQRFLMALPRTSPETLLVCSHSDWLQQAVLLLASDDQVFAPYSFFSCAEFKIFNFQSPNWNFQQ